MSIDARQLIEEARVAREQDRPDIAVIRYAAAAEALRATGQPLLLAHTIRHVGDLERELDGHEAAELSYAEALKIYRGETEVPPLDLANTLRGYALLRELTGDHTAAHTMWNEALELYTAAGVPAGIAEARQRLAAIAQRPG